MPKFKVGDLVTHICTPEATGYVTKDSGSHFTKVIWDDMVRIGTEDYSTLNLVLITSILREDDACKQANSIVE